MDDDLKVSGLDRFYSRFITKGPNECWPWMGCSNRWSGHGCIWWNGRTRGAHCVAYEIEHGAIPEGAHILHSCHNAHCVNPAHLRAGTRQENVDDMMEAGRWKGPRYLAYRKHLTGGRKSRQPATAITPLRSKYPMPRSANFVTE